MIKDIRFLPVSVDIEKLRTWYKELKTKYDHLKWSANDNINVDEGVGGHNLNGMYGWALQSNLEDLNKPCPPYNITKENKLEYRDTEAMFGYVKKIKEFFPYAKQFSVAVHPPGVKVNTHTDSDDLLKVHVPIYTNQKAYFLFPPTVKYILPDNGRMTLVNTTALHGTLNEGDSERVHLFFKIPAEMEKEVMNLPKETI